MPFSNFFNRKHSTSEQNTNEHSTALDGLNASQREAVTTTEGYVRVIAGAGSGKTKALTCRYAYLANDLGVSTDSILCVTFTNKAASVMKRRIKELIGDGYGGMVCTFHSFCVRLLKEDIHFLNYPTRFMTLDKEDAIAALGVCYEALGIGLRDINMKKVQEYIELRKGSDPNYIALVTNPKLDLLNDALRAAVTLEERIFYRYLLEQRKSFALDFNDLMYFALDILRQNDKIREKWQHRIQYLMVDEFQDVNTTQYELASILSDYHKNLFVVGDPDQTIYSWRGAKVSFILDFDKHFPSAKTIMVEENYRSTKQILMASNALIQKNKERMDKKLIPIRTTTGRSVYFHATSEAQQTEWIASQIKSLIEQKFQYQDICILYRANFLSRGLEEGFVKNEIPYTIFNGTEFYARKEIKDVLCYLRLVSGKNDLPFRRVINEPKRGVGKKKLSEIAEYASNDECSLYEALVKNASVLFKGAALRKIMQFIDMVEHYHEQTSSISELLQGVLTDSGYEEMLQTQGDQDRLDNLAELKQSISEYELNFDGDTALDDYLDHIALFTDSDTKDGDTVKLMTVHTAKGLEYPFVFVYELSENIFPTFRANTIKKMEEERRLAYVAYTRAKEFLFLTNSDGYTKDLRFRYPSRFIFNAEKVNLDYVVQLPEELEESAQNAIQRNEENLTYIEKRKFQGGTRINHPILGDGTILEVNEESGQYSIQFDELNTARTIDFQTHLDPVDI